MVTETEASQFLHTLNCGLIWVGTNEKISLNTIEELKEFIDIRVKRSNTGPAFSNGMPIYTEWEWATAKEMLDYVVDCWNVSLNWYTILSTWMFNKETYEYLTNPEYSRMEWYKDNINYNNSTISNNSIKENNHNNNNINNTSIMILPVWLVAWLVIRWISKIKLRIVFYILLFFIAAYIAALLDDAWWKFCYKWHCS